MNHEPLPNVNRKPAKIDPTEITPERVTITNSRKLKKIELDWLGALDHQHSQQSPANIFSRSTSW